MLAPAAHDFQRLPVGDAQVTAEQLATARHCFLGSALYGPDLFFRNSQQQVRIRAQTCPDRAFGSPRNSGKLRPAVEQIQNDLEMEMRRPAAILAQGADTGEYLATCNCLPRFQFPQCPRCQMAVQRKEVVAIVCFVPKDYQRTVI